jgi:hypothetical protein
LKLLSTRSNSRYFSPFLTLFLLNQRFGKQFSQIRRRIREFQDLVVHSASCNCGGEDPVFLIGFLDGELYRIDSSIDRAEIKSQLPFRENL